MSKYFLMMLFLMIGQRSYGGTFIGNGGNAGDLDLAITLSEIQYTFEGIDQDSAILCGCTDKSEGSKLCNVLSTLNAKQRDFCEQTLLQNKEAIIALASKSSKVKFIWTDEPITVHNENKSRRIVDAVAQSKQQQIILNRPRFLELSHSYRIALITHELFHLVPLDGSYISDEQTVGPFKDGKSFLDVLGAATALAANDQEVVYDFAALANVSRAYKKYILQADLKVISNKTGAARRLLKKEASSSASFTFEYKPGSVGYRVGIEEVTNNNYLHNIIIKESMTLLSGGIGYHWSPISAHLSRWNELHVSCFVEAVIGTARYSADDRLMSLEDKGAVKGLQATGQVHIPFASDFWGTAGVQERYLNYQYKDLGISASEFQHVFFIGGAYAF